MTTSASKPSDLEPTPQTASPDGCICTEEEHLPELKVPDVLLIEEQEDGLNNVNKTDVSVESEDDISRSLRCGLGLCRPKCLQFARSIRSFLWCMCLVAVVQSALSAGYIGSQITTLEKRFALGSSSIGFVQSCFEAGYVASVIIVSYFGSRGRIPLWIAGGLIVMSVGAFLFALPQFLSDRYNSQVRNDSIPLCTVVRPANECRGRSGGEWYVMFCFAIGQILIGAGSSPILTLAPPFIDDHVDPSNAPPMIASIYAASAMGPLVGYGLGALMLQYYVDVLGDPVSQQLKPEDPGWVGAWWAGFILLGFASLLMASIICLFPRRLPKMTGSIFGCFRTRTTTPSPSICAERGKCQLRRGSSIKCDADHPINMTILSSIATGEDPVPTKSLDDDQQKQESSPTAGEGGMRLLDGYSNHHDHDTRGRASLDNRNDLLPPPLDYGRNWKELPLSILRLLRNRVYLVACTGICFEMYVINGFASFLPKYLETEYHLSKLMSSILAGGLVVPSGALGILSGGLISNRFKFSRRGAVRFAIIVNCFILAGIACFFFVGCSNPKIAGVTVNYPGENSTGALNLTGACRTCTSCSTSQFYPVCHKSSNITYFSPCFAGCENYTRSGVAAVTATTNSEEVFTRCQCAVYPNLIGPQDSTDLTPGYCALNCSTLVPFLIFLTIALMLVGVTQNPLLMVTIRSVKHHERAFALGFQFVILRLFAYLPSPITYGRVIDAACLYWKWECGVRGDCVITDLPRLTNNLTGLSMGIKTGCLVVYIILFALLPRKTSCDDPSDIMNTPGGPPTQADKRSSLCKASPSI